jgi:hypothetical protein
MSLLRQNEQRSKNCRNTTTPFRHSRNSADATYTEPFRFPLLTSACSRKDFLHSRFIMARMEF